MRRRRRHHIDAWSRRPIGDDNDGDDGARVPSAEDRSGVTVGRGKRAVVYRGGRPWHDCGP